jgi:hypothetical protein
VNNKKMLDIQLTEDMQNIAVLQQTMLSKFQKIYPLKKSLQSSALELQPIKH